MAAGVAGGARGQGAAGAVNLMCEGAAKFERLSQQQLACEWELVHGANVALQSVVMSFLQLPKLFAPPLPVKSLPFAPHPTVS